MVETPSSLKRLVNGQGLKTFFTIVVTLCGVLVAVLTAYYTAEASQDEQIVVQTQQLIMVKEKHVERTKAVDNILVKFDKTLTNQSALIRDNSDRMIEIQTTQRLMRDQLKEISTDVKTLGTK